MPGKVLVTLPVTFFKKVLEDILRNYFEDITMVSGVKEALNLIKVSETPDLIISSYILEDGDVFTLLKEFRKIQKTNIPVVLLTSEEDLSLITKALKPGIVEVILKNEVSYKLPKFLGDFTKVIQLEHLEGNILFLEDTTLYVEFLTSIFSDTKLEISHFRKLEEALIGFEQNDIDLAIIDIVLEDGRSGLDLVRKIRENPEKGHIPIIVLTGYDNPARKIELFKAGADDYITNPLLKEELLIKVFNHKRRL